MKLVNFFIITVVISTELFAHEQYFHQYIVREAWKLVENQVPELIGSDIANWIGDDQTSYCLCVASGAYNEDTQDIIYQNCGWNFLTGCVLTSVNHFWDADAGDNSTFSGVEIMIMPRLKRSTCIMELITGILVISEIPIITFGN